MLRLTIERDNQPAQTREFVGTAVLGRDDGLDLQLRREDGASRRHCQFSLEGTKVFVEDLGSSNGTKLNGKKIDRKSEVKPGDVVLVGTVRVKAAAATAAATKGKPVAAAAAVAAPKAA